MPYSQFTLATVKKTFDLIITEEADIFARLPASLPAKLGLANSDTFES